MLTEKPMSAAGFGKMNIANMNLSTYTIAALSKTEEMMKIKEEMVEQNNAEVLGLKRSVKKKTTTARKPMPKRPTTGGIVIREPSTAAPQPAPTQKRTMNVILSFNEDEDDEGRVPISSVLKKQRTAATADVANVPIPTQPRRQPPRKAKSVMTSEVILPAMIR